MREGFCLINNMQGKKIYLTKEGLDQLKKEHAELLKVKRPDILARVSQARDMGDLSENAEYVAAKEELSFTDERIKELEDLITQASVIHERSSRGRSNAAIKLGSTVMLQINGKQEEFTLVGEWEADPRAKKISHESPLGKALLGKKVGEKVEVDAPAGRILYTVVSLK